MNISVKIWRQENAHSKGRFETYRLENLNEEMSLLEMLDVLNEKLLHEGHELVSFGHDCREGICGACGMFVNGRAHGPREGLTTCQLHLRHLKESDTITIEPWRAAAFPVVKDLMVDRSALDRVLQAGGYVSVNTGGVPDANALPISRFTADEAFASASCIGCGACVATCPNASAMLFVSAKISHLAILPQGEPERHHRAEEMVQAMDSEGFGNCSNVAACEVECPKGISIRNIARLNREYMEAAFTAHLEEHPEPPHYGKGDDDPHLGHPEVSHQPEK